MGDQVLQLLLIVQKFTVLLGSKHSWTTHSGCVPAIEHKEYPAIGAAPCATVIISRSTKGTAPAQIMAYFEILVGKFVKLPSVLLFNPAWHLKL
jgi:hypothetical protein